MRIMWTPALRLLLVAAASATAGWLGSSYLSRRDAEAETSPDVSAPVPRDERPIRTVTWCETCHAHMPLEHCCETAGVRSVLADGSATSRPSLTGGVSAG